MAQAQRLQQDAQEEHGAQHVEAIVDHYFRHLWTAKESVLKLRGDGLSFPPCNASFHIPHMLPLTQSGASLACMHAAQLAILGTLLHTGVLTALYCHISQSLRTSPI
jgi:phosphopantetheinyl transferase